MRTRAVAGLVALLAATGASAQTYETIAVEETTFGGPGGYVEETAIVETFETFDGGYVGGSLGYLSGQGDVRFTVPVQNARLVAKDTVDYDGWDLGIYGGYRFSLDSGVVIGAELGGSFSNAEGNARRNYGGNDLSTKLEKKGEVYLDFKAGAPIRPNVLLYGIGGFQSARFDAQVRDESGGGVVGSKDANVGGWALGLGSEYFLASNISTRLEWKYQSFGDVSFRNDLGGRVKIDPSENSFRLGVSYNF
jgi:opacity protein-like surface antigen